jgi:hypothetical protein
MGGNGSMQRLLLVAVREGAILAGPQGPLWHWLSERKHHQAGRLARQRLDLRVVPLQGKVQKRIVRAATRGLPKWPHFSLPPTGCCGLKLYFAPQLVEASSVSRSSAAASGDQGECV